MKLDAHERLRSFNSVRFLPVFLSAFLLGGCGQDQARGSTDAIEGQTPFEPVLEMHDLMASVLDPATDVIWGAAGSVITAAGEQDLSPVDDAGWQAVFNAAAVVTETGNLLMLPGRAKDNGDWMEYSRAIIDTGKEAMAAAQAQDAQAVFDVGAKLYLICVACHQGYDLPEEGGEEEAEDMDHSS